MAFKSSSPNLDCKNRGEKEPTKKVKKLRSMKLSRKSTRFNHEFVDSFSNDASSEPSQLESSMKSPKYKDGNESDGASTSSSVNGSSTSSSSSSCEEIKTLTNTRSSRPNYLKATSSSEGKKMNIKASVLDCESSCGSNDENKSYLQNSKSNLGSSNLKKQNFKRTTSMRSLRVLINKSSLKSKGPLEKICPDDSEGTSVNRATCSSTLKDSKFPRVEIEHEERESEKVSVLKVCRYNYCSLHGHHHHPPIPPLKRLLSRRRRVSKTQKSMRVRSQSSVREDYSDDVKKEVITSQMDINEDFKPGRKAKASKAISRESKEKGIQVCIDQKNEESNFERCDETTPSLISFKEDCSVITCYDEVAKDDELGRDNSTRKLVDRKKNHVSMWHLIHQQMVSGLAEGNEEKKGDDTNRKCFEDQNTVIENQVEEDQEIDIQKMYVIKKVREAIEKILLPEVPDQPSDDQSICSNFTSEQEPLEKNHSEDPVAGENTGPQQGETVSEKGEKTNKKAPNKWSNLKKLILLKRFVKELEKVRKINPRKPWVLPVDPDQEGEKVSLTQKRLDKKRSTDEWMVDYALRQAVSELAPTQKRKVEVLIKAFETMVQPSDEQQSPRIFPKFQGVRHKGYHIGSELEKYGSNASSTDTMEDDIVTSNVGDGDNNSIMADERSYVLVDKKEEQDESTSSRRSKEVDDVNNYQKEDGTEELPVHNENSSFASGSGALEKLKVVVADIRNEDSDSLEQISTMINQTSTPTDINLESCKEDVFESDGEKLEIDELPNAMDEASTAISDRKHGDSVLRPELRESEPDNDIHRPHKIKLGKGKNISMWHLIHQQMVAGLEEEGKTKENNNENEERVSDVNAGMEYNDMDSQEVELRKVFAIKMVREAIEKILLLEVQDQSSDDQSTISEITLDQELIEKNQDDDGGSRIFNSIDSNLESHMSCSNNKLMYDISLSQEGVTFATTKKPKSFEEKTESSVKRKAEKQTPKGWSNLKKWIVLQRFIKELEKVKNFSPKKAQLLPLNLDPEGEVVRLRNQMANEKKSAEEWMLDYALRKVVSELAPKQKRKVELLVKAFETVVPPTEEMRSPVAFPKSKATTRECFGSGSTEEGIKLKSIVVTKIDAGNDGSTATVEKPDVAMDEKILSESTKGDTQDETGESTATYSIGSSPSISNPLDQLRAAKRNQDRDSGIKTIATLTNKAKSDKQKHMKMWHLLCQHVVSDIAVKVENPHLYGEDDNDSRTSSGHDYSRVDLERSNEDHISSSGTLDFSKSDALKLVREAIEEILISDIQDDSSDTQSIASDILPDQKLLEENHGNVEGPMVEKVSEPKNPRNWNKLKTLILLKRSIRALEKARKSNLQATRSLPLESAPDEKVDLKHQMQDERKKAEEWMLDYSVQHIVTKLTPARKRRVAMLVEAFEAVVPLPQV